MIRCVMFLAIGFQGLSESQWYSIIEHALILFVWTIITLTINFLGDSGLWLL